MVKVDVFAQLQNLMDCMSFDDDWSLSFKYRGYPVTCKGDGLTNIVIVEFGNYKTKVKLSFGYNYSSENIHELMKSIKCDIDNKLRDFNYWEMDKDGRMSM